MLSGIKNFVITFCIAALLFGLAAYFVVNYVTGDSGLGAFFGLSENPNETDDPIHTDTPDTGTSGPETVEPPETDENGNEILRFEDLQGSSFGVVLIGTDYQPSLYDDYAETEAETEEIPPEDGEASAEETEPETVPEDETAETEAETEDLGFPDPHREIFADSITLVYLSKETGQVVFLPIPANTKVMYDGVYYKLGSLYDIAGGEAVCEKIATLTGFYVPYYAGVSMEQLAGIVELLGGVEYNVPVDMQQEIEELSYKVELSAGIQKLSGEQAVAMLRYKGAGDTLRQSLASGFLQVLADAVLNKAELTDLVDLYSEFVAQMDTNYTLSEVLDNKEMLLAFREFTVTDVTYPGSVAVDGDMTEYFIPDTVSAIRSFVKYRLADN